jgi:hypothetical protein
MASPYLAYVRKQMRISVKLLTSISKTYHVYIFGMVRTTSLLHRPIDIKLGTAFWYFLRATMRIVDPVAVIGWFRPPMDRGIPANGTPQPRIQIILKNA